MPNARHRSIARGVNRGVKAATAGGGGPTLTDSGPVVANANDQVIENLRISAGLAATAVSIGAFTGVQIRNCAIRHETGRGIYASGGAHSLSIDHVTVLCIGAPASGANANTNMHNIEVVNSTSVSITNVSLRDGSSNMYIVSGNNINISNANGYNARGPEPRGQFVQFNQCTNTTLRDFYSFNDFDISFTEDNVNYYHGDNHICERGCVDGNNSPTGVGYICDGSDNALPASTTVSFSACDAIHQGDGCFTVYGAYGVVLTDCRTKDGHNTGVGGRATNTSNGLTFASSAPSQRSNSFSLAGISMYLDLHGTIKIFNVANSSNVKWQSSRISGVYETSDFTPRGEIILSDMPIW